MKKQNIIELNYDGQRLQSLLQSFIACELHKQEANFQQLLSTLLKANGNFNFTFSFFDELMEGFDA